MEHFMDTCRDDDLTNDDFSWPSNYYVCCSCGYETDDIGDACRHQSEYNTGGN